MALGKSHDQFNLYLGVILGGILSYCHILWTEILVFWGGFYFSTFIFPPDTDIIPRKRLGLLRPFLFPYSMISSHRGLSHHVWWGTIGRLLYLFVLALFGFYIYCFFQNQFITVRTHKKFLDEMRMLYSAWGSFALQWGKWFLLGVFAGDLGHYILDKLSDIKKKIGLR